MVFEVDNTTEILIHKLQESIEDTISALEDGQRDLRRLIEGVKGACEDLATADQADEFTRQLSELRREQQKAATAQQVKDLKTAVDAEHKQVQQGMGEMAGMKEQVTGLGQTIQTAQHTVMDTQRKIQEQFARQILEQMEQSGADRLRSLQELSDQLMELASDLTGRLDGLISSSSSAANTAAKNQAMLTAITAYLSLPGYKRFFRGMGAIQYETAQ
ncbi:MAG: hypothetical protein HDT38_01110 [Clostridiales bacterium]|nr:hypothetical protein [Clostridiales bacterium]